MKLITNLLLSALAAISLQISDVRSQELSLEQANKTYEAGKYEEALKMYESITDSTYSDRSSKAEAFYKMGVIFEGKLPVALYDRAFNNYLQSDNYGHKEGAYKVADLTLKGFSQRGRVSRNDINYPFAIDMLTHSAETMKNIKAQARLGQLYERGYKSSLKVQKPDFDKMLKYYEMAMKQGDYKVMCRLSVIYNNGIGLEEKGTWAFENNDNEDYEPVRIFPKDKKKAYELYEDTKLFGYDCPNPRES